MPFFFIRRAQYLDIEFGLIIRYSKVVGREGAIPTTNFI
jgi:hypothetical protein